MRVTLQRARRTARVRPQRLPQHVHCVCTTACALHSMSAAEDMHGMQQASPYTQRLLTPGVYFDRDGTVHCGGWVTNFRVGDFGE